MGGNGLATDQPREVPQVRSRAALLQEGDIWRWSGRGLKERRSRNFDAELEPGQVVGGHSDAHPKAPPMGPAEPDPSVEHWTERVGDRGRAFCLLQLVEGSMGGLVDL